MREDWTIWNDEEWGAFYRIIQGMADHGLLIAEHPAFDGVIVGGNLRIMPNTYKIGEGSIILYYSRKYDEERMGTDGDAPTMNKA